jgi:hypothetical protein
MNMLRSSIAACVAALFLAIAGPCAADDAFDATRAAAEQGDAGAQAILGLKYEFGTGVPQDHAEAVRWYRRAADQGNAWGQSFLGVMYDNGTGVPQDYAEAVRWYRLAAAQGDASAQGNLGFMYGNGTGVLQDYVAAHMWFNLSAAQSNAKAVENRDSLATEMTSAQIAEAQRLARDWTATPN